MSTHTARRVAIYARLSISNEDSVSISRQVEACQKYAEARGWTVVGVFTDDGVSATATKPEDRKGWSQLLAASGYDAVVVWKIDRLARKVLDFLHADEALQERGAGIVAVEDPIDMTNPQGRAFAVMLSVFGEMEAAAISARVTAARKYLIENGRVPARMAPFGYRIVPNPDGAGKVLAKDPETIGYVQEAAEKVLAGKAVNAVATWLTEQGVKAPRGGAWNYSTVDRLLRNPTLAGMTPLNPGRKKNDRGTFDGVLRGADGLPVVNQSLAILSTARRRALIEALDNKAGGVPRASQKGSSVFLAGALGCGHCTDEEGKPQMMIRGKNGKGSPVMKCPVCYQTVGRNQLDDHIVSRLLEERSEEFVWEAYTYAENDQADLTEIEEALKTASAELVQDGADVPKLLERIEGLKELRSKARTEAAPIKVKARQGKRVKDAWNRAQNDEERREVLLSQTESIVVSKGRVGRKLDTDRVVITWRQDQEFLTK